MIHIPYPCIVLPLLLIGLFAAGIIYGALHAAHNDPNAVEWHKEQEREEVIETVKKELEEAGLLK